MRHRDPKHAALLRKPQRLDQAPRMEVAKAHRDMKRVDRLRERTAIHTLDHEADGRHAPRIGAAASDDAAVIAIPEPRKQPLADHLLVCCDAGKGGDDLLALRA